METVKIVINAVDYLDKIKKIPGELYNFLCYDSVFYSKDTGENRLNVIKYYDLMEGTLLCSKLSNICVGFIGHRPYRDYV